MKKDNDKYYEEKSQDMWLSACGTKLHLSEKRVFKLRPKGRM